MDQSSSRRYRHQQARQSVLSNQLRSPPRPFHPEIHPPRERVRVRFHVRFHNSASLGPWLVHSANRWRDTCISLWCTNWVWYRSIHESGTQLWPCHHGQYRRYEQRSWSYHCFGAPAAEAQPHSCDRGLSIRAGRNISTTFENDITPAKKKKTAVEAIAEASNSDATPRDTASTASADWICGTVSAPRLRPHQPHHHHLPFLLLVMRDPRRPPLSPCEPIEDTAIPPLQHCLRCQVLQSSRSRRCWDWKRHRVGARDQRRRGGRCSSFLHVRARWWGGGDGNWDWGGYGWDGQEGGEGLEGGDGLVWEGMTFHVLLERDAVKCLAGKVIARGIRVRLTMYVSWK